MVARLPPPGNPPEDTGASLFAPRPLLEDALLYGAMSTNAPSRPDRNDPGGSNPPVNGQSSPAPRLLITAGPTHEPIDNVRYLANRSSGRLGVELASAAAQSGWQTTLLLGPAPLRCTDTRVTTFRFSSTADLESLLAVHAPACDCLIMAAAVADFRPRQDTTDPPLKVHRTDAGLTLHLEATPDLLAGVARARRPEQVFVGFALEPRKTMIEAARAKLIRKRIDMIIANPLETMDSDIIEAVLIENAGAADEPGPTESTPGPISKVEFARWLLDRLSRRLGQPSGKV